jgi:hypothetical protein
MPFSPRYNALLYMEFFDSKRAPNCPRTSLDTVRGHLSGHSHFGLSVAWCERRLNDAVALAGLRIPGLMRYALLNVV